MVDHVALSLSNLYVSDEDMANNGGMRAARSSSNLLATSGTNAGSVATSTSIQLPPQSSILSQVCIVHRYELYIEFSLKSLTSLAPSYIHISILI
jgi:hypothetical protein